MCTIKIWYLIDRYKDIPEEHCLCVLCDLEAVEDEFPLCFNPHCLHYPVTSVSICVVKLDENPGLILDGQL